MSSEVITKVFTNHDHHFTFFPSLSLKGIEKVKLGGIRLSQVVKHKSPN